MIESCTYQLPTGRPYWRKIDRTGDHADYHFMVGNTTLAILEANPCLCVIPDVNGVLFVPTHLTVFVDLPDQLPNESGTWSAVDCTRLGGVRIVHRVYRAYSVLKS